MLHYSCDMCKRPIDICCEPRHVVKIDVFQAIDDSSDECGGSDDEFDHLDDVQDLLQRIDEQELEMLEEEVTRTLRFDLCDECRRTFLKNPLGGKSSKSLNFSNN
ncbi:MAG: hypothetical protein ISS73_04490 [Pirellulales bacterium]|jgi:hypothetical protein|nr:hypothetical protein [Pirellulales bacterium]MDA0970371.1 hypothetical protein [Planctomycetota bacterium]